MQWSILSQHKQNSFNHLVNDSNPNTMVKLIAKTSFIKVSISLLIIILAFTACQSVNDGENQAKDENTSLALKHVILDMEDDKTGATFSLELDYPEDWNTEMISSNVFHASENSRLVNDGLANNFHAIVFNDSLNHDIKRYTNNFHIKEQSKFPGMEFQVVHSESVNGKKRSVFQIDQTKIWGNTADTLFSISALAKINKRIVHLNFYSNYEEREALEVLAKDVVKSVQITE